MQPLDESMVRKVAQLANLQLDDHEIAQMQTELTQILSHVEQLQQLDTEAIDPLSHAADVVDRWREDKVRPSLSVEEALANAPEQRQGMFVVPDVLDGDDES